MMCFYLINLAYILSWMRLYFIDLMNDLAFIFFPLEEAGFNLSGPYKSNLLQGQLSFFNL